MITKQIKTKMIPYRRGRDIDYASLDFIADVSVEKPDGMLERQEQMEVFGLLIARFTDFHRRPDVFVDYNSNICYDRRNLNVRISPDIYIAFGVDDRAIRPRQLYLPWEAGKPPDWVLEIGTESTWQEDIDDKPGIYAQIGVSEYWRFDPTGGDHYGYALAGDRLADGKYRPIELTTEPDGILKGYSEALELSFCWDDGWPRLYDPATGAYVPNWQQAAEAAAAARVRAAEAADRAQAAVKRNAEAAARAEVEAERNADAAARVVAEAEIRQLREQIRRLQEE